MSIQEQGEPKKAPGVPGGTERRGGIRGTASEPVETEVTRTPFEAAVDKAREIAGQRLLYAEYRDHYFLRVQRDTSSPYNVIGFELWCVETDYLDNRSRIAESWSLDARSRRYHYKEYAEATYTGYRKFESEEAIANDAKRMLDILTD